MSAPREQRIGNESGDAMRNSMRLSRFEDEEEDDYGLNAMGISDGFRPSNTAQVGHNRMSSRASGRDITGRRSPPPRPSSITKPQGLDSFTLRHDGSTGPSRPAAESAILNEHTVSRASSGSTNMPMITADTPYQGPTGPSHPYHMYPQGTRPARTASVATASTFQPSERSYTGPSGPTHPYGMYPQDTTAGNESPDPVAAIPVGFPGRRDEYRRRIGPDGEEAGDIIGPMGHTEQLPPYTQYPMEAFGKPLRGILPVAGAGGMGLATRNPEFASREDLSSPQSRQSIRSLTSSSSGHQVNMAAMGESEKVPEKRWKQIARKKLCGIVPVWAVVLAALVLLIFVIILGTVLRILGSRHHPPPRHSGAFSSGTAAGDASGTVWTTVTTTLDASALPSVPTGIPTLPTGTFALPIIAPYSTQQTCLDNSDLYSAWSCALPMSMLQVTIERTDGDPYSLSNNNISITHSDNTLDTWFYGSQPPTISTQQTMNLVKDLEQAQFGPAWFFQVPYDKIVVVNENTFTPNKKRGEKLDRDDDNFYDFRRKGVAQPGEKPWFCYWNGTLLETFIYVNNTSSGASFGSAPSTTPASTTPSFTNPSGTTAPTASTTGEYTRPNIPPAYPKIIKVEERRIPRSPKPYCDQMIIQSDGTAQPNLDEDGIPIRIQLNETEPAYRSPSKRGEDGSYLELEERQSSQQCTCVWLTS